MAFLRLFVEKRQAEQGEAATLATQSVLSLTNIQTKQLPLMETPKDQHRR